MIADSLKSITSSHLRTGRYVTQGSLVSIYAIFDERHTPNDYNLMTVRDERKSFIPYSHTHRNTSLSQAADGHKPDSVSAAQIGLQLPDPA